jgi:hypothetical protein
MYNKFFQKLFICLAALLCTNCSYIQKYLQETQYSQIENKITLSTLDKVNEYTSQTPFHKTYEFEFNKSKDNSYALIFYLSESRFSKSIIKHRNAIDLHRNAIRIDNSKNILTTLNKSLPHADSISWQQVSNQVTEDEARDGYHIMQEYIRLKIRDL